MRFGARGTAELRDITAEANSGAGWRVEADWVDSIRSGTPVRLTDFSTGRAYMQWTDAVWDAMEQGCEVPIEP